MIGRWRSTGQLIQRKYKKIEKVQGQPLREYPKNNTLWPHTPTASSLISYQSSLITHHSPWLASHCHLTHHTSHITHHSSHITHHTSLITHYSSHTLTSPLLPTALRNRPYWFVPLAEPTAPTEPSFSCPPSSSSVAGGAAAVVALGGATAMSHAQSAHVSRMRPATMQELRRAGEQYEGKVGGWGLGGQWEGKVGGEVLGGTGRGEGGWLGFGGTGRVDGGGCTGPQVLLRWASA